MVAQALEERLEPRDDSPREFALEIDGDGFGSLRRLGGGERGEDGARVELAESPAEPDEVGEASLDGEVGGVAGDELDAARRDVVAELRRAVHLEDEVRVPHARRTRGGVDVASNQVGAELGIAGARRLEPPESDAREEDETSDDARRRSWSAMTGRARKCQSWSGRDDFRADEPASGGARHDRRFARVPKRRRRGGSPAVCAPRVRRTRAGLCDARADAFARRDCCWIFEAWCWRVARVLRVYLGPRAAPPGDLPTVAPRHRLPRATMDPEAGEAPTPASAVDLRKPLRMTALYLVTFTALLVGASLAPTADAVDKPAVASARRVMEAPEPRPSALSRVVAPLERDHAVPAPPADELSPAAVAVGADGGGEGDAPSSSSLPECAFHVYRHLSKTGGTTVRFVFDKQTAMGEWEYPLSYGFDEAQWTALLARWRAAARAWRAGDRAEGPAPSSRFAATGRATGPPKTSAASSPTSRRSKKSLGIRSAIPKRRTPRPRVA